MTTKVKKIPELGQIIGALLFGSKEPLSLTEIRRVIKKAAATDQDETKVFAQVSEKDLEAALVELQQKMERQPLGFRITETARGYRLQNDPSCSPWLRQLLEPGKPNRLSAPALETLAIIAYRQPCMRATIEAVRGVDVDQMVRNLLEMQMIKMVGRSPLPGRPWLLGTTQQFLDHFGVKEFG